MAVVTHAGSTWNTTAGDKTVTATPAVGDLIVVVAASSGLAGGTTAVTDDQGGSGANTYIQVDSDRTGFSTTGVLTVWVRPILVTSAVSTIYTAAQSGSTGGGLVVLRVAGMIRTGAAAIRGNGGESTGGAGTTPAPVLSFIPLLQNPIITACANGSNGAAITQRTGYTETEPAGYNSPATGLSVSSLNSGETSQTITYGGTSATAFASFALELDASTPTYTRGMSFPPGRKMPRKPLTEAKGEVAATVFQQALDATVATSATIIKQVNKIVTASTVGTTATITKSVGKLVTASTVATTATIRKQVNKLVTASTVATVATLNALKVILVTLTATVGTTATMVRQVGKIVTASTVATTATIRKQVNKIVTASTVATVASLIALKVILVNLTATVATSATMIRRVNKTMSATVATVASVTKSVGKTITASTVATTATLGKSVGKNLTATVATLATISRQVGKVVSAVVSTTATIIKQVGKTLTATVSTVASLVADFVSGVIAFTLGHFDEPTPAASSLDEPTPGASSFDEPTPGSDHFDEPTPS